jgi:hypothetical protein
VGGVPRPGREGDGDEDFGDDDGDAVERRGVVEAPQEALFAEQLDADGLVLGAGEALQGGRFARSPWPAASGL